MKYPKQEVVFFAQILVIYTTILASIANLSRGADNTSLWVALLSSSIGYMLPNPSVHQRHGSILRDSSQQ